MSQLGKCTWTASARRWVKNWLFLLLSFVPQQQQKQQQSTINKTQKFQFFKSFFPPFPSPPCNTDPWAASSQRSHEANSIIERGQGARASACRAVVDEGTCLICSRYSFETPSFSKKNGQFLQQTPEDSLTEQLVEISFSDVSEQKRKIWFC